MKMEDIAISITGYSYSNKKETIPDGVDKEEIAAVYEEIIDEYLQKGIPREIPALINVSGVPGAGKSTFCKKLLAMPENSSAIYIGFDAIMENERLPYIREEVNHAEEAFKRWELSARIAGYELLKRAIENKYLIIFDHSSALSNTMIYLICYCLRDTKFTLILFLSRKKKPGGERKTGNVIYLHIILRKEAKPFNIYCLNINEFVPLLNK